MKPIDAWNMFKEECHDLNNYPRSVIDLFPTKWTCLYFCDTLIGHFKLNEFVPFIDFENKEVT